MIAPALMTLAGTMVWLGEFDEGERWLQRTAQARQSDTGPDIRLLLHQTAGMLHVGRGRRHEALEEFGAAEDLASQLVGSQALASQMTGWMLAAQARLGRPGEARTRLAALDDERASSGEIRNARAVICLAEGDPADILDVLHGSTPPAREQSPLPSAEELTPSELRVLRYLPTNLSRPEIAGQLSVSPNTVNAHIRSIYAKLQVRDRSSAVRRARELRLLVAGRTR